MKRELFVEIGAEELPAKEVMMAVEFVRDTIISGLDEARLGHGAARIFATPRRLVVVVPEVDAKQEDVLKEVAGPPVKAAFKDGQPTKAAEGFAKGLGLTVNDLVRKETPKGEYLYARVEEKGRASSLLLPEILSKAVSGIPFKRSMRWGHGDATFARPLQWIVALFGGEVVRFSYGDVESGRKTRGHRFLAQGGSFDVENAAQWQSELEKRFVIADVEARKKKILDGANKLASAAGGRVRPDDDLIAEVVQLVEYPVPMIGTFDSSFLEIPQEVLISEMREHQRYLSVIDGDGKLLPCFVVVANTTVEDPKIAIDGYRRVLAARFQDGKFFFNEDQKIPLADRIDRLKQIQFHRALGTTYEKVERVVKLAFWLAGALRSQLGISGLDRFSAPSNLRALADGAAPSEPEERFKYQLARAGWLMKTDLTTKMVFEFPELQGSMGRAYASKAGEPVEISAAIEEHYMPRNAGDSLPRGVLGALLGMADRLDTICGIFSTGKGPTGAADPFGLRRAALAILNVLRDRGWHVSLNEAIAEGITLLGSRRKKEVAEIEGEIGEFFRTRLKGLLTGGEITPDVAEAVLSAGSDDIVDAGLRTEALAKLRKSPELEPVAIAFKRVANILREQTAGTLDRAALKHEAERALIAAADDTETKVAAAIAARDFAAAFAAIAAMRPAVDKLFDAVMVMDPDATVRANRLALVARVQKIFAPLADFTKLS